MSMGMLMASSGQPAGDPVAPPSASGSAYLYPVSDFLRTAKWNPLPTFLTYIWEPIDEDWDKTDDSDYALYTDSTAFHEFRVDMSDPIEPPGDRDVQIVFRTSSTHNNSRYYLYEGASIIVNNFLASHVLDTRIYTLSSGEKASVGNWDNVRLGFSSHHVTTAQITTVRQFYIKFQGID